MVRSILELCNYEALSPDNMKENIQQREARILQSSASMMQYYSEMMDVGTKSNIYSNYVDDRLRSVITKVCANIPGTLCVFPA